MYPASESVGARCCGAELGRAVWLVEKRIGTGMYRLGKLAQHVATNPVVYARIADGDYERSKHKLKAGDTVVVTGAAGFVGGWLVTYCLERGCKSPTA